MLNEYFDDLIPSPLTKVLDFLMNIFITVIVAGLIIYLAISAIFFPVLMKESNDVYIPNEVSIKCAQSKECSSSLKKVIEAKQSLDQASGEFRELYRKYGE